jgi:hypothetical protein
MQRANDMAYVSKQDKLELAPAIKAVLNKYDMKGSISVRNHSTLVVKIKQGAIDFADHFTHGEGYIQVNEYWIDQHYAGIHRAFLNELLAAMKGTNYYNNDDAMVDYFDRSHYTDINIGAWNKPYAFVRGSKINVSDLSLRADPNKEAYLLPM